MRLPKLFNKIEIICSCGRTHMLVNGFVVATEGDTCRDPDLVERFREAAWSTAMMEYIKNNRV